MLLSLVYSASHSLSLIFLLLVELLDSKPRRKEQTTTPFCISPFHCAGDPTWSLTHGKHMLYCTAELHLFCLCNGRKIT